MTRDELIEELRRCPYNSEVEFKIEPGSEPVSVESDDRFVAVKVSPIPTPTITIE